LISALGQIDDCRRCVTMDLKQPGDLLYLVGLTRDELGGSHFALVEGLSGGDVPTVDCAVARRTFCALHAAISAGLLRACHDASEGGLAVAAAEMALAGGLGARIELESAPRADGTPAHPVVLLFSESNTRFVCEVPPGSAAAFEQALAGVPLARVGEVVVGDRLQIALDGRRVVDAPLALLKETWQAPLRWE
jgi:phosphoribosylformylglycinamidine synthase